MNSVQSDFGARQAQFEDAYRKIESLRETLAALNESKLMLMIDLLLLGLGQAADQCLRQDEPVMEADRAA